MAELFLNHAKIACLPQQVNCHCVSGGVDGERLGHGKKPRGFLDPCVTEMISYTQCLQYDLQRHGVQDA